MQHQKGWRQVLCAEALCNFNTYYS